MPDAWVPAWPAQKALLAIVARIAGSSEHAAAAEASALACPRCGPTESASLPDCLESAEFKAALASPGSLYFHYPAAGSDEAAAWAEGAGDAGSAPASPGVAATQAMILECLSPSKRRAGAGGVAAATRFSMLAEAPLSPLCFEDAAGGADGRDSLASLASADTATEAVCRGDGRVRDSMLSAYDASGEEQEEEAAAAEEVGASAAASRADDAAAAAAERAQHSSSGAPTPAPTAAAAQAESPCRGSPPGSEAEAPAAAVPTEPRAAGTSLPSADLTATRSTGAPVSATADAQGSSSSGSPAYFAAFLGLMLLLVLVMQALSGRQEAASPAANSGGSEL
jgi:hypothetical protein